MSRDAGRIRSAARADLGFRYTVPFAEGARRVIAWREGHGGFQESAKAPFYETILDAWKRLGAAMAEELAIGGKL